MTRKLSGALALAALFFAPARGRPPRIFSSSGPPARSRAGGLGDRPKNRRAAAVRGPGRRRRLCGPLADGDPLGDGQVRFAEFQVWAEPVGNLITGTLVDDLGRRLGPDRVLATPSRLDFSAEYRLTVDVLRFDVDDAGDAVLDARWTLLHGQDGRLVTTRRSQPPTRRRSDILPSSGSPPSTARSKPWPSRSADTISPASRAGGILAACGPEAWIFRAGRLCGPRWAVRLRLGAWPGLDRGCG